MKRFQFSALLVLVVVLGVAPLLHGAAAPTTYNAITDLNARPKPPLPALGGAGTVIVDPTFGTRILRVTDSNTVPGDPTMSYHTPSGGFMNGWNSDGTIFITGYRGDLIPFRFDPVSMKASRIQDPSAPADKGGLILNFNPEGWFSYRQPNIYYGMSGTTITQFDFTTLKYTPLFDGKKAVPGAPDSTSSVSVSDDDSRFVFAFGGTGNQDGWANVVVWNRITGATTVLDTNRSNIDGSPTNISLGCGVHSAYIDRSGRFVIIGTSGGAHDWLVWDIDSRQVGYITKDWTGHDVAGFGVRINQDGYCCSVYDPVDFQKRPLDIPSLDNDQLLIPPSKLPADHGSNPGVHESWNNAQPGIMVPLFAETYRDYVKDTSAWRAWDDEIIGVATDGSGTVWRFCHHRSQWTAGDFWATPRVNVSQDGRYAIFTSNWERSLGTDNATNGPRQDVFVVELNRTGTPPPPAAAGPAPAPAAPAAVAPAPVVVAPPPPPPAPMVDPMGQPVILTPNEPPSSSNGGL